MVAKVGTVFVVLVMASVLAGAAAVTQSDGAVVAVAEDVYVALTAQAANFGSEETIAVAAGGLGKCAATEISYLQFDLNEVRRAASDRASLVLEVTYASSANSGIAVLYAVPDVEADGVTPWREGSLTWLSRPDVANAPVLASVTAPQAAGKVTFESQALAVAINRESAFTGKGDTTAGDNKLSLAVQLEGCTGLHSVVRFAAAEHASEPAPVLTLVQTVSVWLPLLP